MKVRSLISVLLILVMFGGLISPAMSMSIDKKPYLIDDTKLKEIKFKQLYRSDKDFKRYVDQIRKILSKDKLSDKDWKEFKKFFNIVFKKIEGIELNDKEFGILKHIIEKEKLKIKVYKCYSQTKGLSTTASVLVAYNYLPKLYQPIADINNGNKLIRTYAKVFDENIYGHHLPGKYIIEVTYVFSDEDYPNPIIDRAYDWYRYIEWGRFEDIETFFLIVDKSTGRVDKLSFVGLQIYWWNPFYGEWRFIDPIYSGSATWNTGVHEKAKVTSFNTNGTHPIVYINTWNHAIGERDNNPSMRDVAFNTWLNPVEGSRINAENEYSTCIYNNEKLTEVP